jgi:6-phosphogluconate dehydrogenase (decarboxylating)
MVHNRVEYGMMDAIAEGLSIITHTGVGKQERTVDAETAPLRASEAYSYDIDVAVITAARNERFESHGLGTFSDTLLSAMRNEFGGHAERKG